MGANQLLRNIKRGREGKNIGIPTGMSKLDAVTYGIQRRSLVVVAADQGSGKTSYSIASYVYNLYKNRGDKEVNILYYSFEMSGDTLFAKLLSLYIFDTFSKEITYETILSLTSPISDEDYDYIVKSEKWLFELEKVFTIYDKSLTPGGIFATCKEWLKLHGEFVQVDEHKENYIEHNSEAYKVVLVDHIGLVSGADTKKVRIDTTCDYLIYFRNKCNITGIIIQQINRNSKSVDRKLNGYELLQLDDLSDSSATGQAAEVVLMIYYPYREKVATCEGYPIQSTLKSRGRIIQVCKNRYGRSEVNVGASFFGEIGLFVELPQPKEITNYEVYTSLDKYREFKDQSNNLKTDENEEYETDMTNDNVFKM